MRCHRYGNNVLHIPYFSGCSRLKEGILDVAEHNPGSLISWNEEVRLRISHACYDRRMSEHLGRCRTSAYLWAPKATVRLGDLHQMDGS